MGEADRPNRECQRLEIEEHGSRRDERGDDPRRPDGPAPIVAPEGLGGDVLAPPERRGLLEGRRGRGELVEDVCPSTFLTAGERTAHDTSSASAGSSRITSAVASGAADRGNHSALALRLERLTAAA